MRIPVVRGLIDRRILVNYKVDPSVLAPLLPSPFRLKLVNGVAVAGICLIRLKSIRPRFVPSFLGFSSENAAHRIAVEWDHDGTTKQGVFVPRRDTSSRFNTLLGGRLFPGVHSYATFRVQEHGDNFRVELTSKDQQTHVLVQGQASDQLPSGSVFGSMSEASRFFEEGSLGYSATATDGKFDGLELRSFNWQMRPLNVSKVSSSFFENRSWFPEGSARFDSALLMQGIDHEWHGRECLCAVRR